MGSSGMDQGFEYNAGHFSALDAPGIDFIYTDAMGINNGGQIAGTYLDSTGYHGFEYSMGTFTTIEFPFFAGDTAVYAINNNGQILGVTLRTPEPAAWSQFGVMWAAIGFLAFGYSRRSRRDP